MSLAWNKQRAFAVPEISEPRSNSFSTCLEFSEEIVDDIETLTQIIRDECRGAAVVIQLHDDHCEPRMIGSSFSGDGRDATALQAMSQASDATAQARSGAIPRSLVHATFDQLTAVVPVDAHIVTVTVSGDGVTALRSNASERLKRRTPLFQLLFRQWLGNAVLSRWNRRLTCAIDHCDLATIILGRNAEIQYANATALSLLADGDGIRKASGRLECAAISDTLRLISAVTHLNSAGSRDRGMAPVFLVHRGKRRPLLVTFAKVPELDGLTAESAASVVYVIDPEKDLAEMVEPACALYGLTPSETKLACALVQGASIQEAARALRLQENTARSYLKQIFAKTETNRQAELVQLVVKSAIRVSSPLRKRAFH